MRTRNKLFGLLWIAALAACFLAWPSPVAAQSGGSDRTGLPGLNFLFDKDAYAVPGPQAETGMSMTQKSSRLAVKLYGGFSRLAAGDVNAGSDGYFELLALYGGLGFGTAEGGYSPVHWGYNFGADVIYQITPMFGVGVGAGYMRNSEGSLMTLVTETSTITLSGTPTLSAVPIRLGVFLTVPVAGKIDLTADAGATYYAGLKFDATQRLEFAADNWEVMSARASRSSLSDNLGFQGSLGFEYKISPRMGFFVEAVGRYARFKNFNVVTGTTEASGAGTETTTGKLYIETFTYPEGTYSAFTIESSPPVDNPPTETFREPKIDLSGFSLQAGIRIRF